MGVREGGIWSSTMAFHLSKTIGIFVPFGFSSASSFQTLSSFEKLWCEMAISGDSILGWLGLVWFGMVFIGLL